MLILLEACSIIFGEGKNKMVKRFRKELRRGGEREVPMCFYNLCFALIFILLVLARQYCIPNPCKNGGTCIPEENGYRCTCLSNYEGNNCESKFVQ